MVVLERIPVPVLAIDDAGVIVFTNTAFAQMLGYTTAHVRSLTFADLIGRPCVHPAVNAVRDTAGHIVDLVCADGFTVKAQVSRSVFLRADDHIALVTFQDVTESLWNRGPTSSAIRHQPPA